MKFTPEQVRRTAIALFTEKEFLLHQVETTVKAIEFLDQCLPELVENPPSVDSDEPLTNSQPLPYSALIDQLTEVVTNKKVHITAAAKGVGVHPVTLRSWIQRDSTPRPDKLAALERFLTNLSVSGSPK